MFLENNAKSEVIDILGQYAIPSIVDKISSLVGEYYSLGFRDGLEEADYMDFGEC